MQDFLDALEKNIADKNWYGAIVLSLTLPDICGKIEYPNERGSGKRYALWFESYLGAEYTQLVQGHRFVFLSGNDCYALRCALLHEGSEVVEGQRAQEYLSRFHFRYSRPNQFSHCNWFHGVLQLEAEVFATDVYNAVEKWASDVQHDEVKKAKLGEMLKLY